LVRNLQRGVRGIERQVAKERMVSLRFDKFDGCRRENVRTVTGILLGLIIVPEYRIKITAVPLKIRGHISDLAHASTQMNQRLIKALVARAGWIIVPEVPFSKYPGLISSFFHHLGNRDFLSGHDRPAVVGVVNAGSQGVSSGQQTGSGGGTDGGNIKILKPDALSGQLVQVGRPDVRFSVKPKSP